MNGWTATKDRLPEEGQEVTVRMDHGQIRQVVKDKKYSGGWKQVNCTGWEMVTWHADSITHWRPEIFERPKKTGPADAPWMPANVKVRGDGPAPPARRPSGEAAPRPAG